MNTLNFVVICLFHYSGNIYENLTNPFPVIKVLFDESTIIRLGFESHFRLCTHGFRTYY